MVNLGGLSRGTNDVEQGPLPPTSDPRKDSPWKNKEQESLGCPWYQGSGGECASPPKGNVYISNVTGILLGLDLTFLLLK